MAKPSEQASSAIRAIIAALVSAKATDTDDRIRILTKALVSHGVIVVGTLVQRRGVSRSKLPGGSKHLDLPLNNATVIGPGKVQELERLVQEHEATVVYFLNDLSVAQSQRIGRLTGCSVLPCLDESNPPAPI